MLRRTIVWNVHLFTTLLPTNLVKAPQLITSDHLAQIKNALKESSPFVNATTNAAVTKALTMCTDVTVAKVGAVTSAFDDAVLQLRGELNAKRPGALSDDPYRRLQIHECIMAAGFYQRAASPNVLHGEGTRFITHHFNFDVRRDTVLTKAVHASLLESRVSTPESDKLLSDLLLLERKVFGKYRFVSTSGRRWLCLGVELEEITSEKELERLLALPSIKNDGNLSLKKIDDDKELWYSLDVEPADEPCFITARDLHSSYTSSDVVWTLRVNKPPIPLTFWERVRERLLRYWVIWFSMWMMFFMVDEEIIALVSLIILKWKQMRNLQREADKTGDKIYIAQAWK